MWDRSETDAVRRAVSAFRWQESGEAVRPSDDLIARLMTAGRAYKQTPYQVAAILQRKETEIRRKRRLWPQKPAWFLAILDRACARYQDDDSSFTRKAPCVAAAYPENAAMQAELASLLSGLVAAKGF